MINLVGILHGTKVWIVFFQTEGEYLLWAHGGTWPWRPTTNFGSNAFRGLKIIVKKSVQPKKFGIFFFFF